MCVCVCVCMLYVCMYSNALLSQDTSTLPMYWLPEVLGKIKKGASPGSITQIFEEVDDNLVTFKLIHDDTNANIWRKPDTNKAVFGQTGIIFHVEDYP